MRRFQAKPSGSSRLLAYLPGLTRQGGEADSKLMFADPTDPRDSESPRQARRSGEVAIRSVGAAPLSPAQVEFNRLMKRLEEARVRHTREQSRLDKALEVAIRELMPWVEQLNRANLELVVAGRQALHTMKLTPKRRRWLGEMISGKAANLLADPIGLSADEVWLLETVIEEFGSREDEQRFREAEESDRRRAETEQAGWEADRPAHKPRKPTKAQLEQQRLSAEREQAKKRDIKSLFKQLAKALHPDLETDPVMKQHKDAWMKRLNTAYEAGDLRDMLQLEMEWLGEEASNLASAGEEKLRVYCSVLKEQLADLKRQTEMLLAEPQYRTLRRFNVPVSQVMENARWVGRQLMEELRRYRMIVKIMRSDTHERREMIHEWADESARDSRQADRGF